MKRKVHRAFVEEINDNIGRPAFVASCHESRIRCDWVGWPDFFFGDNEARAIRYALDALDGKRGAAVTCEAEHVL